MYLPTIAQELNQNPLIRIFNDKQIPFVGVGNKIKAKSTIGRGLSQDIIRGLVLNRPGKDVLDPKVGAPEVIGSILAYLAPVIIPIIIKKGVDVVKNIVDSSSKKDDAEFQKEIINEISKMNLDEILSMADGKLNNTSLSILETLTQSKKNGEGIHLF